MKTFSGKVAFITGGASGIGLALGKAFVAAGARVMLADLSAENLTAAKTEFADSGAVDTVVCDVADSKAVRQAAQKTTDRFGKVNILVNNAGVGLSGQPGEIPLEDWRWLMDINLMGVVHGIETFVPLMQAHGEGGYIVNTASMAGHFAAPGLSPYNASKYAVVGLSETIAQDLAPKGIGVSVLCPAWVKTNIHKAFVNRPSGKGGATSGGPDAAAKMAMAAVENGIAPEKVAAWTLACMAENRFYIFTHPEMMRAIDMRADMMKQDYAACVSAEVFQ